MDEAHLTLESLARLLSGGMTYDEMLQSVVPHLLALCPECRQLQRKILELQEEVGHWNEEVVVSEAAEARELWDRLSGLPYEEQIKEVGRNAEFQIWGFCRLLLRKSLNAAFEEPATAVDLANLAVDVSLRLGDVYHPEWVEDLRARAFSYLGNARRVLGELRSADDAFRQAEAHVEQGTGDPRIRAEILDLKSSLRRGQRRLKEALALSQSSLSLYRSSQDLRGVATALLKKANLLTEMGHHGRAVNLLRRNMGSIEAAQDARLSVYARFNLLGCLTLAKRYEEAASLVPEVRLQLEHLGEPLNLFRLRWTEGNIALGLGRIPAAEAAFLEVQAAFLERRMAYDVALVSLDLAAVYLREARLSELKQLAADLILLFESRDVHREALGALYLFQKAVEEERLTQQAVVRLVKTLRQQRTMMFREG